MTAKLDVSTTQGRLRIAALVVLVLGLLSAAVVIVTASTQSDPGSISYRIVGGKAFADSDDASTREMQQLERLGGKASVLTFKFNRWLASLWSGRRLAFTLAVLSVAFAAACFHVAGLMDETGPP
jgi:hypothetical protein